MNYPKDWPRCPRCGDYALDGHITCGQLECNEMSHLPQTVIGAATKAFAASGRFVAGRFEVEDGALTKIADAISPTPRGHFMDAIKNAVASLKAEREGK